MIIANPEKGYTFNFCLSKKRLLMISPIMVLCSLFLLCSLVSTDFTMLKPTVLHMSGSRKFSAMKRTLQSREKQMIDEFLESNQKLNLKYRTAELAYSLPQAVIIGTRKAGTGSLRIYLNAHSQIQGTITAEGKFFSEDSNYLKGLNWYQTLFPNSTLNKICIEKSPHYLTSRTAPIRVKSFNPGMKLILLVRDPVARLLSDYAHRKETHEQTMGGKYPDFEEIVSEKASGKIRLSVEVKTSLYALYFAHWLQYFPRHQFLIVNGDTLNSDPFPELKRIEKFLDIRNELSKETIIKNTTSGFFCAKKFKNKKIKCLNKKGRPKPKVDPKLLKKLKDFYRPWNKYLFELSGQKFDW